MQNKKVEITADCFDPETGDRRCVTPRTETIDLRTNELFKDCKTLTDIAERYMWFWNRFPTTQKEMVFVQSLGWVE
jgi:hypothetical protein